MQQRHKARMFSVLAFALLAGAGLLLLALAGCGPNDGGYEPGSLILCQTPTCPSTPGDCPGTNPEIGSECRLGRLGYNSCYYCTETSDPLILVTCNSQSGNDETSDWQAETQSLTYCAQ